MTSLKEPTRRTAFGEQVIEWVMDDTFNAAAQGNSCCVLFVEDTGDLSHPATICLNKERAEWLRLVLSQYLDGKLRPCTCEDPA